jgi:hypothetical protein
MKRILHLGALLSATIVKPLHARAPPETRAALTFVYTCKI